MKDYYTQARVAIAKLADIALDENLCNLAKDMTHPTPQFIPKSPPEGVKK